MLAFWLFSVACVLAEPLSKQQLAVLIKSGLESKELQEVITKNGLAEAFDAAALKDLRDAGADNGLIVFLVQFNHAAPAKAIDPPGKEIEDRMPTDEEIKAAMEEQSRSGLGNLARIEASQLGITDRGKIEQFVADYCKQNARVVFDPYYDSIRFRGRCQPFIRNGKIGYMLKGKIVVEPEWDAKEESFTKTGAGKVTFHKFTAEGAALVRQLAKGGLDDLARLEAQNKGLTSEIDVDTYRLSQALKYNKVLSTAKAKKINLFASSSSLAIPASDDPAALTYFEKNGAQGLLNASGVVYQADKNLPHFNLVRILPAWGVEKSIQHAFAWCNAQEETSWQTTVYHKNFQDVVVDQLLSTNSVGDFVVCGTNFAQSILRGPALDSFWKFCDGKLPSSVYIQFQQQNDTTWRANLMMIKTERCDPKDAALYEIWEAARKRMAPLYLNKPKK